MLAGGGGGIVEDDEQDKENEEEKNKKYPSTASTDSDLFKRFEQMRAKHTDPKVKDISNLVKSAADDAKNATFDKSSMKTVSGNDAKTSSVKTSDVTVKQENRFRSAITSKIDDVKGMVSSGKSVIDNYFKYRGNKAKKKSDFWFNSGGYEKHSHAEVLKNGRRRSWVSVRDRDPYTGKKIDRTDDVMKTRPSERYVSRWGL